MTPSLHLAAMLDQLQAATESAQRGLPTRGDLRESGSLTQCPPQVDTIVDKFDAGVIAGTITTCRHLRTTAMTATWWATWRPDRMRCGPCMEWAIDRYWLTAAGVKCTLCDVVGDATDLHNVAALRPGRVDELWDGFAVVPPITILTPLCAGCFDGAIREGTAA